MEFAQQQNRIPDRAAGRDRRGAEAGEVGVHAGRGAGRAEEAGVRRSWRATSRSSWRWRKTNGRVRWTSAQGAAGREVWHKYTEKADRRDAGRVHQEDGARVDPERRPAAGRAEVAEVRPIWCQVVLPRVHGTGLFTRADAGAERHDARRCGVMRSGWTRFRRSRASGSCTTTTSRRTRWVRRGGMGGAGRREIGPRRAREARGVAGAAERRGLPVHDPRGVGGAFEQRQHVDGERMRHDSCR